MSGHSGPKLHHHHHHHARAKDTSKYAKLEAIQKASRPLSTPSHSEDDTLSVKDKQATRPQKALRAARSVNGNKATHAKSDKHVHFAPEAYATPSAMDIDFTNVVTLVAGEGHSAHFKVHKNLLARSSSFFDQLLQPGSGEADDDKDTLILPGIKPKGLNIFLHWLYDFDLTDSYRKNASPAASIKYLSQAHVLGQLADIPKFRNYCVDEVIYLLQGSYMRLVNKTLAEDVYPSAGQTKLATLCVDFLVWDGDKDPMGHSPAVHLDGKLKYDIEDARHMREVALEAEKHYLDNPCDYHEEVNGDVCCKS